MVCVLSEVAGQQQRGQLEQDLRGQAETVNGPLEKHARIGAVIISTRPWTIENGMLTPTLKLRRPQVENRFGKQAEELARRAAEQGRLLLARETGSRE